VFSFIPPFVATVDSVDTVEAVDTVGVESVRCVNCQFIFGFVSVRFAVLFPLSNVRPRIVECTGVGRCAGERTAQVAGRHGSCWHLMLRPSAAYSTYGGSD